MTGPPIDISLPLAPGIPVWPGDPPLALERVATLAADGAEVSRLATGVHVGTHVDAPRHYLADGAGVDSLDLAALIGTAHVVAIDGEGHVDAARLAAAAAAGTLPAGAERVLLRTRNTDARADGRADLVPDFAALAADGAAWLVARGVRLVGIDGPSIAPWEDLAPAHVTLLAAGVVVVEGLDLTAAESGEYTLVCLPLRLVGCDGAPARAVLLPR